MPDSTRLHLIFKRNVVALSPKCKTLIHPITVNEHGFWLNVYIIHIILYCTHVYRYKYVYINSML